MLSILTQSLVRGSLMKWQVLIPLGGVASTGDRESLLWGSSEPWPQPCRCTTWGGLPVGGSQERRDAGGSWGWGTEMGGCRTLG